MAPNRQIRRSGKISSPARNLMGHQRHTQIVPECVCRLLSTPSQNRSRESVKPLRSIIGLEIYQNGTTYREALNTMTKNLSAVYKKNNWYKLTFFLR